MWNRATKWSVAPKLDDNISKILKYIMFKRIYIWGLFVTVTYPNLTNRTKPQ